MFIIKDVRLEESVNGNFNKEEFIESRFGMNISDTLVMFAREFLTQFKVLNDKVYLKHSISSNSHSKDIRGFKVLSQRNFLLKGEYFVTSLLYDNTVARAKNFNNLWKYVFQSVYEDRSPFSDIIIYPVLGYNGVKRSWSKLEKHIESIYGDKVKVEQVGIIESEKRRYSNFENYFSEIFLSDSKFNREHADLGRVMYKQFLSLNSDLKFVKLFGNKSEYTWLQRQEKLLELKNIDREMKQIKY